MWRPERGTRFGVIPIHGRGWETRFFEADNCYIYHYYNGYQQGDTLVFYAECLSRVSVEYPDWHFNVRASNTEPLIRLNLEATTQQEMERRRDEVLAFIRA